MRYNLFRSFLPDVSYEAIDSGAAGGSSSAGTGATSSNGGGQQTSQPGQQGSTGQGGTSPMAFSEDMEFLHEGKPTKLRDIIGTRTAATAKETRATIENELRKLAANLKAAQQQTGQHRQQPADPLAGIRDQPILNGQQFAQALDGTLGPVMQQVAQLQKQNQELAAHVKRLSGGMGTLAKERGSQERSQRVEKAITSLGEGYDPKDPFLQDVAQDVLDAWEFDKPEEFQQILGTRLKAAEDFVKRKQQADLKRAKTRLFTRPGGNASPNGAARMDPKASVKHAADILFGQQTGT